MGQLKNYTDLNLSVSILIACLCQQSLWQKTQEKQASFKRKVLWLMKHCFIGVLQHVRRSESNSFQRALMQISLHKEREGEPAQLLQITM